MPTCHLPAPHPVTPTGSIPIPLLVQMPWGSCLVSLGLAAHDLVVTSLLGPKGIVPGPEEEARGLY